ncbi:MAG: hypothetical protein U0R17_06550 [Acidimicrobiia bacterium]
MDLVSTSYVFHPTYIEHDSLHSFFAYDSYIEQFWLPLLGPTATLLINNLTLKSLSNSQTFYISKAELSLSLGTGYRSGDSSPIQKQLIRLSRNKLIYQINSNEYLIPKIVPQLGITQISKLSNTLRTQHDAWITRLEISPISTFRRKIKQLVLKLQSLDYDNQKVKNILNSTGLHPSIIAEALELADQSNVA